jgi:hypothetical protein
MVGDTYEYAFPHHQCPNKISPPTRFTDEPPPSQGAFYFPIKNPAEAGSAQDSLEVEDKICREYSSNLGASS